MMDDFWGEEMEKGNVDDSRPVVNETQLSDWETRWFNNGGK